MSTPPRPVLRATLRSHRGGVARGAALVSTHQLCEAAVPVTVGLVVDAAVRTGGGRELAVSVVVLVALFAVLSSAGCAGGYLLERTAQRAAADTGVSVVARALRPGGGLRLSPGEVLSTATSDARRVGFGVFAVAYGTAAVVVLVASGVVLVVRSPPLGAVVLLGLLPTVVLVQLLSGPLGRRAQLRQDAAAQASSVATDLVSGLRVLAGLGAGAAAAARYRTVSATSRRTSERAAGALGVFQGASVALTSLFLAAVALLGGRLALSGQITVGELVAAVGLAQFLLGPVQRLVALTAMGTEARASGRRVDALLGTPEAVRSGAGGTSGVAALDVDGVVLADGAPLRLQLAEGEHVAVVAGAADARELLALLARDRDPEVGRVSLGGVPLPELQLDALRAALLVAPHEAALFAGTVADNVGAHPRALAAARTLDGLGAGAATAVGAGGLLLSGGQRQRVALARALATDAPVLVLHDPTTAVDAATEAAIADGLAALRAGRSTLVLTSSPALLARADRVVVLRDGVVHESGTHADLARTSADYRALVLR